MMETTPIGSLTVIAKISSPRLLCVSPVEVRASEAAKRHSSAAPPTSPRACEIGFPDSSDSISAKRSTFCSIRSATFVNTMARSFAAIRHQRPLSKARRAAATAKFTSASVPFAARLTTTPCDGATRSVTSPDALSKYCPSMKCLCVTMSLGKCKSE